MRIAVLGTGTVGRALAPRVAEVGHDVAMGTRDPEATLARAESDRMGNPPLAAWSGDHPEVEVTTFADAAARAALVLNATNGAGAIAALEAAGEDALAGKVVIDVTNPLEFSADGQLSLFVANTDSLAEQLQRRFPAARVVKALNTVTARLMVEPGRLADGEHTVFLSGNDPEAKATAADLLRSFGWSDVMDLGDLTTARGAEMYLPLWLSLMRAVGTPMVSIKVVR